MNARLAAWAVACLALCAPFARAGEEPEAAPAVSEPLKPRFELHVPAVHRLLEKARASVVGEIAQALTHGVTELSASSSDGLDFGALVGLLRDAADWTETGVDVLVFAPDTEGRARFQVRFDWPLAELRARVEKLLATEGGGALLEGVRIEAQPEGGARLALPDATLGYLLDAGEGARFATHADLELPAALYRGNPEERELGPAELVCRLNLAATETDSGASFWSSLHIVTDVEYSGRLNADGVWEERVRVNWPPLAGLGAKAALGRVKQTFFAPREAFGALALNTVLTAAMLDSLVGLGPQVIVQSSGEMEMIAENELGPLGRHAGSEVCVTVLPGMGFLPAPDVVAQTRLSRPESFVEQMRKKIADVNKLFRDREQPEPWHETEAPDGRPVFWREQASPIPGAMMPLVLRNVVFISKESDDRGREREFAVLGWTTTAPERLVRRWLGLPRGEKALRLPQEKKTNGETWINWRLLYGFLQPHLNLALSAMLPDTLLPSAASLAERLVDGYAKVEARYTGLEVVHRGPLPAGAVVVPGLLAASLAPDTSGGSDLARERLAAQRLRVLYHHSKLFRHDLGRWPAEVAELDGYIDFAGSPQLLQLRLSAKKRSEKWWASALEGVFGEDEDDEDEDGEDEDEDERSAIDDSLYEIKWGREQWRLGFAADTFDHIADLYIDQDGEIHRVVRAAAPAAPAH